MSKQYTKYMNRKTGRVWKITGLVWANGYPVYTLTRGLVTRKVSQVALAKDYEIVVPHLYGGDLDA
jgi:hypothetical protein